MRRRGRTNLTATPVRVVFAMMKFIRMSSQLNSSSTSAAPAAACWYSGKKRRASMNAEPVRMRLYSFLRQTMTTGHCREASTRSAGNKLMRACQEIVSMLCTPTGPLRCAQACSAVASPRQDVGGIRPGYQHAASTQQSHVLQEEAAVSLETCAAQLES